MSDCIERMRVLEELQKIGGCGAAPDTWTEGWDKAIDEAYNRILRLPAADVAPVVHGRWDDSGRYTFPNGDTAVVCPNCGCALTESEYHLNNWNYCPVCGDKMDGKVYNVVDGG